MVVGWSEIVIRNIKRYKKVKTIKRSSVMPKKSSLYHQKGLAWGPGSAMNDALYQVNEWVEQPGYGTAYQGGPNGTHHPFSGGLGRG